MAAMAIAAVSSGTKHNCRNRRLDVGKQPAALRIGILLCNGNNLIFPRGFQYKPSC
jgi:hypothetical protein